VLSFHGGFHGRTAASLACTHSKYIHKIDVPLQKWPVADFPKYKYPLDEYTRKDDFLNITLLKTERKDPIFQIGSIADPVFKSKIVSTIEL
jgi:4-aminobutyrate aminotransferase-like enzyme